MLSEHEAGELRFAGVGAQGASAAEAAARLAEALHGWVEQHEHSRIAQLTVQPAGQDGGPQPFGLAALIVYTEGVLDSADAAEAVAAAVEEIQNAQADRLDTDPPRFV